MVENKRAERLRKQRHRLCPNRQPTKEASAMSDFHFTPDVEIFKTIPNFPGYEVSNLGRVRSYWKQGQRCWFISDMPQRILYQKLSEGYPTVQLGSRNQFRVHVLVLSTFRGPCPPGMEGCHKDGDRTKSHLKNLKWGTWRENFEDKVKHGRNHGPQGEKCYSAKLTEEQVLQIRKLRSQGHFGTSLAKQFGVTSSTIYAIISRHTWNHLL